ncbi:MAG: carbon storage regulator CsrA [Motiliproteus sp.]|jgi:carbon storage regulator CsrA
MLQIVRQDNEAIKIGDNITIYVTRTRSHEVRLSIDAPREIYITCDGVKLRNPLSSSFQIGSDASY